MIQYKEGDYVVVNTEDGMFIGRTITSQKGQVFVKLNKDNKIMSLPNITVEFPQYGILGKAVPSTFKEKVSNTAIKEEEDLDLVEIVKDSPLGKKLKSIIQDGKRSLLDSIYQTIEVITLEKRRIKDNNTLITDIIKNLKQELKATLNSNSYHLPKELLDLIEKQTDIALKRVLKYLVTHGQEYAEELAFKYYSKYDKLGKDIYDFFYENTSLTVDGILTRLNQLEKAIKNLNLQDALYKPLVLSKNGRAEIVEPEFSERFSDSYSFTQLGTLFLNTDEGKESYKLLVNRLGVHKGKPTNLYLELQKDIKNVLHGFDLDSKITEDNITLQLGDNYIPISIIDFFTLRRIQDKVVSVMLEDENKEEKQTIHKGDVVLYKIATGDVTRIIKSVDMKGGYVTFLDESKYSRKDIRRPISGIRKILYSNIDNTIASNVPKYIDFGYQPSDIQKWLSYI